MGVLEAYFDASGHEDDPNCRVVTVAGFISTYDKWRKFERDWAQALAAESVTLFHMKEFAHSTGEFRNWRGDEERRRRFLGTLIRILQRRTLKAVAATLLLDHYRALDRELQMREYVGTPYEVAAQFAAMYVRGWGKRHRPKDAIINVFEKGDDQQAGLQRSFSLYFSGAFDEPPVYVDKRSEVGLPLQAADLIAYEHAKAFNDLIKTGKTRVRKSAVPFMPRENDRGIRFIDRHMLRQLCRDLRVPTRRA